jgi:hypothetical protein
MSKTYFIFEGISFAASSSPQMLLRTHLTIETTWRMRATDPLGLNVITFARQCIFQCNFADQHRVASKTHSYVVLVFT